MTREQLESLSDDELNREVLKALGWKYHGKLIDFNIWTHPDYPKGEFEFTKLPDYVHDMNKAMELLQLIRDNGFHIKIHGVAKDDGYEGYGLWLENSRAGNIFCSEHDNNLARAICLAWSLMKQEEE